MVEEQLIFKAILLYLLQKKKKGDINLSWWGNWTLFLKEVKECYSCVVTPKITTHVLTKIAFFFLKL